MSRFSGPQHKGAQAAARAERRAEAEVRNLLTAPERRKDFRRNPIDGGTDGVTAAPIKRKRTKK